MNRDGKTRPFTPRWLAWPAAAAVLVAPALAAAQQFEKVTGPLREEIPARPLVGAAYAFIWIALLVYVVLIGRGLGRVRDEVRELRGKVDRAAGRPSDAGTRGP
jgi:CcmD family protein